MWVFALLGGCGGTTGITGFQTYELFPFDCEREWEFLSTDITLPYKLIATSDLEPEAQGRTNIYTVVYTSHCVGASEDCVDGEVLRKVQWSSTNGDGVFIHGFAEGEGALQAFDPPIQIGLENMLKGDVATTTTGGANWTSTLDAIEACPVAISNQWDSCYKFLVETDAGDGAPIAGSYWTVGGQGVVALEVAGDTGQWQLSSASAVPSDALGTCDGSW